MTGDGSPLRHRDPGKHVREFLATRKKPKVA